MPKLREILSVLSQEELREISQAGKLPHTGSKQELIRRLTSGLQGYDILQWMGKEQLQAILRYYERPTSGTKDALVERILDLVSPEKERRKETKTKCEMCGHLYDQRAMHRHHFIPKAIAGEFVGGTIWLCALCHSILHRRQDEEEAKKGRELTEKEMKALFNRTKKERLAGKYGRA